MKKNQGFTLVELIIVITILTILVGVTIGGIYIYISKARTNTDINNMRALDDTLSVHIQTDDFLWHESQIDHTIDFNKFSKIQYPKGLWFAWSDEYTFAKNADDTIVSPSVNNTNVVDYQTTVLTESEKQYILNILYNWNDGTLPSSKTGNVYICYVTFGGGHTASEFDDKLLENKQLASKVIIVNKEKYYSEIKNTAFSKYMFYNTWYTNEAGETFDHSTKHRAEDVETVSVDKLKLVPFYEED